MQLRNSKVYWTYLEICASSRWRKRHSSDVPPNKSEIPQRKIYNLHIYRHGFFMIQ